LPPSPSIATAITSAAAAATIATAVTTTTPTTIDAAATTAAAVTTTTICATTTITPPLPWQHGLPVRLVPASDGSGDGENREEKKKIKGKNYARIYSIYI
jgi:hypothetical protein